MTDTPYSTTKALWHDDRIEDLAHGTQPWPVHVQMILSDWCNQNCAFCSYRMDGNTSNELFQIEKGQTRRARNPKRFMPTEKAKEIIDDCRMMGVKAVQFTGGGEPTVHPQFIEIVQHAQALGLETALVTNGSNLVDVSPWPVLARMAWIRVSVDAGKPETYCKVRDVGLGMWERVTGGLRDFSGYLAARGSKTVLGAGFVVTPDNWTEMAIGAALLRDLGVHNVRLGLMFNPRGSEPYAEIREDIENLARQCERELTRPGFTVINRVSEKLHELDAGSPPFSFCSYQHLTTYIGADLNLYRCCVLAYNSRGLAGSLKEQRFAELWQSQGKDANFRQFNPRACARCQFTEIIQNINDGIVSRVHGKAGPTGKAPLHVNFV